MIGCTYVRSGSPHSLAVSIYTEAVQLADTLGYDIVWQRRAKP